MKCGHCGCGETRVTDSRAYPDAVRRRRQCARCLSRWTTYEVRADANSQDVPEDLDKIKLASATVRRFLNLDQDRRGAVTAIIRLLSADTDTERSER